MHAVNKPANKFTKMQIDEFVLLRSMNLYLSLRVWLQYSDGFDDCVMLS